ncbi:MAG: hypothetical protein E7426_03970 [Ruminococcaceae bacterium]|nr:hypothetical protein [Oscillospiraceae bacterium]
MSTVQEQTKRRRKKKRSPLIPLLVIFALVAAAVATAIHFLDEPEPEPIRLTYRTMYVASPSETVSATVYDEEGQPQELVLYRGTQVQRVEEELAEDAMPRILLDEEAGTFAWLPEKNLSADEAHAVTTETVYARRTVNLLDEAGVTPGDLVQKGDALAVTGFQGLGEDGSVARWQVEDGWIRADLTAPTQAEAAAVADETLAAFHAARGDSWGGGEAGGLDYDPWEKPRFADNPMPETVKALYMNNDSIPNVEDFIDIADHCGINAFVVDIMDGGAIGYASPTMEDFSPSAYRGAYNTLEDYQHACRRLKEAGYYIIGRITAFNDPNLAVDHPECLISDVATGAPLKVVGMYWPSVYDRTVWKYKVDLALEAVELMGFNEIQFDYMRFPDGAWSYEQAGTIDYHNTYGESKAQAVQRFLMYAAQRLHDAGVYISCDVFGECAEDYVTAYGQYWPAMSAVVDAISGMPYPDHYPAQGNYLPWEHPYETLLAFGQKAMARQSETPGQPAAVRTWIQAYNAIREPYPTYGPDEVAAQIRALQDAGCTGGYMTWNGAGSRAKYRTLMPGLT